MSSDEKQIRLVGVIKMVLVVAIVFVIGACLVGPYWQIAGPAVAVVIVCFLLLASAS
jgi:hypothetical protein